MEKENLIEIYQDYIDDEGYVQRYNYDRGRYYNTGTCLRGPKGNCGNPGRPGKDGLTPRINQDNGHWMIGDVDTGVMAGGEQSDWNQNDSTKLDYIKNKPTISSGSVILNDSYGAFDLSVHNAVNGVPTTYADLSAALTALNALDSTYKKPGMSFRFVRTSDNKYVQFRFLLSGSFTDTQFTNASNWLSENVDTTVTQGSVNLISSGAVANKINILTNGENTNYDPTVLYLVISSQSTINADLRSVWDNTNIKNEESGTCTINWGNGVVPITSRDSLKNNLAAGKHTVVITGITSLNGNTLMKDSQILIDAKIPNTLTTINNWLFNGVSMNEVTFMAKVPPTFGSTGQSTNSLNGVTKIKVPKSSLSAYQTSTMSSTMKAKLEGFDEGINGDIVELKGRVDDVENDIAQTQENLTELSNHVDELHKEYDKSKTYFTIELASTNLDLRNVYNNTNIQNETSGSCFINWGDGSGNKPIISDDSFIHTYSQLGTYEIEITGLTGLTSNQLLREVTYLKSAKFGNTFVNVGSYFMLNGSEVESVEFFATTPLTWGTTSNSNMNLVDKIIVPKDSLFAYLDAWPFLTKKIFPDEDVDFIYNNIEVTVGNDGDFQSLKAAIRYLSKNYPIYKYSGVKAIIKILSGTVITEQIYVDALDLSWITIEYEDYNPGSLNYDNVAYNIANGTIVFDTTGGYNSVAVDATNFGSTSHDQRGDFTLFRAENGARLPIIGCVFKLTTPHASTGIAGIVCNRGSEAVVKTLCGFIGFQDGVISNNESSITIREGITMNCSRWGCHARHNGEVSARSVIATGCATNSTYASEYGAAVADRVADMDVREAYLSGNVAIRCNNASTICARATHVINSGVENGYLVEATYSGRVNASNMTFDNIIGTMLRVQYGGWIDAFNITNKTYNVTSLNTIDSSNGIIFG